MAKKGLDRISGVMGDRFPLSKNFDQSIKNNNTPIHKTEVQKNAVVRKRNESFYAAGKNAFRNEYGTKTDIELKNVGIEVQFNPEVASESIDKAVKIAGGNPQVVLDIIPRLKELLENSYLLGVERTVHTGNKENVLFTYRLYNTFDYDEKPYILASTANQNIGNANAYMYQELEILPTNKNAALGNALTQLSGIRKQPAGGVSIDTVAELYRIVKKIPRKDGGLNYSAKEGGYQFDYQYSVLETDSEGKELSEEQAEFFKDSRIRIDEYGNTGYKSDHLMPMYHATSADEFTVFLKKKRGENTAQNTDDRGLARTAKIGFWFNSQDLSKKKHGTGNRAEKVYLNITDPAHYGLEELAAELEDTKPEDFVFRLKHRGYDGIVLGEDVEFGGISAVAFESNQIKRVTNTKPTPKRDIRYSIEDERAISIKEQIAKWQDELNGMEPVAEIKSGTRPKRDGKPDKALMRKELQEFYGSIKYTVDRNGFGKIEFDENALSNLIQYIQTDAEFAAAKAAPMVVKRGDEIDRHTEHKGRVEIQSYTFAAPVILNGKRGNEAVVIQYTNRNKPHAVRILMPDGTGFDLDVIKETDQDRSRDTAMGTSEQLIESVSKETITSKDKGVKQYSFSGKAPGDADAPATEENKRFQMLEQVYGSPDRQLAALHMDKRAQWHFNQAVKAAVQEIYDVFGIAAGDKEKTRKKIKAFAEKRLTAGTTAEAV